MKSLVNWVADVADGLTVLLPIAVTVYLLVKLRVPQTQRPAATQHLEGAEVTREPLVSAPSKQRRIDAMVNRQVRQQAHNMAGRTVDEALNEDSAAAAATSVLRSQERRQRFLTLFLMLVPVICLTLIVLGIVQIDSTKSQTNFNLTDASNLGAVVSIIGGLGTFIGIAITSFARLIKARGDAAASVITARAELERARAEVIRARRGLPPGVASLNAAHPSGTADPPLSGNVGSIAPPPL